jgi:hypothetical protein
MEVSHALEHAHRACSLRRGNIDRWPTVLKNPKHAANKRLSEESISSEYGRKNKDEGSALFLIMMN